eukprot:TRINITY_DN2462_c0_g1_i2.p1 TRINITY_DN2462_c0_g1~~TRINITY_DN2462_c0_g1_i2.p1  ORF type:complete len:233 (-),score=22.23 TRINITY_DN2462_c0_g1_i2:181-879(-)
MDPDYYINQHGDMETNLPEGASHTIGIDGRIFARVIKGDAFALYLSSCFPGDTTVNVSQECYKEEQKKRAHGFGSRDPESKNWISFQLCSRDESDPDSSGEMFIHRTPNTTEEEDKRLLTTPVPSIVLRPGADCCILLYLWTTKTELCRFYHGRARTSYKYVQHHSYFMAIIAHLPGSECLFTWKPRSTETISSVTSHSRQQPNKEHQRCNTIQKKLRCSSFQKRVHYVRAV